MAHRRYGGIVPLSNLFDNEVTGIVDVVGIVASAAFHRVGTGAAVYRVVERGTDDRIAGGGADEIQA